MTLQQEEDGHLLRLKCHINCLEFLTALFALKCFQSSLSGKHVKIMIDNTTAVSVINSMGTCHSDKCNSIGIKIWEFCMSHNIVWLTAAHIPGSSNCRADNLEIFALRILNG